MLLFCFASFLSHSPAILNSVSEIGQMGDHESALTNRASQILGVSPLLTIDASEYCFSFFLSFLYTMYSVVVIVLFPFRDS